VIQKAQTEYVENLRKEGKIVRTPQPAAPVPPAPIPDKK
jgi:hypothetical protein